MSPGIGHSRSELDNSDIIHPTLDDGMLDAERCEIDAGSRSLSRALVDYLYCRSVHHG